ncbi:hypothetical protein B0O99DRAFT_730709 [Bisporella sp. PMI_857]|nr:hypothetical protein B0O99DRAFT_730709 [Bisporella sp. PMI_857]
MKTNTYKKKRKEVVKRSYSAEARVRSINNTKKIMLKSRFFLFRYQYSVSTITKPLPNSVVKLLSNITIKIEYELIVPRFVKYLTGCNVEDNTSLVRFIDDADSIAFAKSINKKTKDAIKVDMKSFWSCINCRDFLFTQDNFKHPKGKNYVDVIILLKFKESPPAQPRKKRHFSDAVIAENKKKEAESSSFSASDSELNLAFGGSDKSDTIGDKALAGPLDKRQRFDRKGDISNSSFDIVNTKEPGNFLGESGYSP